MVTRYYRIEDKIKYFITELLMYGVDIYTIEKCIIFSHEGIHVSNGIMWFDAVTKKISTHTDYYTEITITDFVSLMKKHKVIYVNFDDTLTVKHRFSIGNICIGYETTNHHMTLYF